MTTEIIFQIITILSGLALFLFGMKFMSDGLEAAAGAKFKSILEKKTKNRVMGVILGGLVTMVIQSSSATTVTVVGLVNAGVLRLAQAVGIVMGANIGTTITGVIVSLNISQLAPIAITLGVVLYMMVKKNSVKYTGQVIAGFGILFLGMGTMSGVLKPLAKLPEVQEMITSYSNPLTCILFGMIFTMLIQSSSATTGVVITLGIAGMIDLKTAVFIIYGCEIGTCITALIASIGASKAARRVPVVHFSFNIIGTILFTFITLVPVGIGYLGLINKINPAVPLLDDAGAATGLFNIGSQIAMCHVIFNVTTTLVLLPFVKYLVKLAETIVPIRADENADHKRLLHIDPNLLSIPHIAVEQTHLEVERMGLLALENYHLSVDTFLNRNKKNDDKITKNEEVINFLNHEISKFLVKLSGVELEKKDRNMIGSLHHVINDIERIGDHAENIMEFSAPYIEDKNMFSEIALNEFREITSDVENVVGTALGAFAKQVYDRKELDLIMDKEEEVDDKVKRFVDNHINRLNEGKCTPTSGMLFVNMLSDLERVSDHAANIAQSLNYKGNESVVSQPLPKAELVTNA
jgi:phosphate:Na+ symporter